MVRIIEKEKNLQTVDAVKYSINKKNYDKIIKTGWASIALSLWGHDDPERDWDTLDNTCIVLELDEGELDMVNRVAKKDKVDIETAVSYFLIFTMDALGYHI